MSISTDKAQRNIQPHALRQKNAFLREFKVNTPFFLMLLPGIVVMIINNYLPMFGVVIAFKNIKFHGNFMQNIINGAWVGLDNFRFVVESPQALIATRNTIFYNLVFIILGLVIPVSFAIALNELKNKYFSRFYQSVMFLPYFISWIVVSYLAYALLSTETGFLNKSILIPLGLEKVSWYFQKQYWPYILTFFQVWKYTGYNTVVYLAAISGIDSEYYEAAEIDGATRWQQVKHITLPLLQPLMIILTLLAVGRIFNADFGLFYNVPRESGSLFSVTDVIDTYVFRGLKSMVNIGMTSAAGTYQAVIGCITVVFANMVVRRIDKEKALF